MKIKMTKQRKEILDIFKKSDTIMSVELIHQKLNDKSINLSTVYRTIDIFMQHNLIGRIYFDNLSYYYFNRREHTHYMVCENCHKMYEIGCFEPQLNSVANENNFKMQRHDLVIYGICKNCH